MKLFPSPLISGILLAGSLLGQAHGEASIRAQSDSDLIDDAAKLFPLFDPPGESSTHSKRRSNRRSLKADTSIVAALTEELDAGVNNPKFTLTANYFNDGNLFTSAEPFVVNVAMTNPSVTEATKFSIDGGPSKSVGTSPIKYLIADHEDGDGGEFAILAVDTDKGTVHGLVQQGSKLVSLTQESGGSATVTDMSDTPARDWTCFADELDASRRLSEEHHEHHEHTHHHDHDHGKVPDLKDTIKHLGIDANIQNRRRVTYQTDDYPLKWSYQVDVSRKLA